MQKNKEQIVKDLFYNNLKIRDNVFIISENSNFLNQEQTNNAFSEKWIEYSKQEIDQQKKLFKFQKEWYLKLYGFSNEKNLQKYLSNKKIILDAGCGLGYKAKWFADLSPESFIIAMDYSDSIFLAAKNYSNKNNLIFVKNDISNTQIKNNSIDYVSCDQVIHHTEDPQMTAIEFSRILKIGAELAVYVYAKKALPRELIDDYFREKCKFISKDEMWKFSQQLTELGKRLSKLKIKIDVPEIPLLNIKAGKIDIQRFIYWNFLKCYWNDEFGEDISKSTNYDWYSPSNAYRYSKDEFEQLLKKANFMTRPHHSEEACHAGRFTRI